MKQIIGTIVLLVNVFFIQAQSFDDIMNKVIETYQNTDSYKVNMKYIIYSDSISKLKKDELNGELIKNGNNYYFNMDQTEIIFTEKFNLKISHLEKMAVYSKLKASPSDIINSQTPFVMLASKFHDTTVKDGGEFWVCTLENLKSLGTYNKILLHVSKKNYSVIKQVYFFNTSIEKYFYQETDNAKKERLEIVQTQFNISPKIPVNLFNLDKYILKKNELLEPSIHLKNYRIIIQ